MCALAFAVDYTQLSQWLHRFKKKQKKTESTANQAWKVIKKVYTIRFYIYLCMQAVRTVFKQRRMKANVWDPHTKQLECSRQMSNDLCDLLTLTL